MSDATVPLTNADLTVREPFEQLYAREFASLARLAMALVDTPEQAEEVVQDAFAALYLKYRVVGDPLAYVRASVLNGGRKVLRRRRLMRRQPPPVEVNGELTYNHVVDAVRRLPVRQRDAILLRYELQLCDAEIAAAMHMPVGTVKSTIHRAIARLRQEIQP
jgi:RNA polymerase sigma factor (sigma-70 family)